MIHIFHGFLGSPDDFSFLKRDDVVIHDLYEMNEFPHIREDDILVGYSMGGRIAIEIASQLKFNIKKLVLINAHSGLDEEEKFLRTEFETLVMRELEKPKADFLNWWNHLPIFSHDAPLEITDERYKKSPELFFKYRLSQQKNHLPELSQNRDKVLYIVGLYDEKYMDMATNEFLIADITVKGIPGGHRVFQLKDELKDLLVQEGIL